MRSTKCKQKQANAGKFKQKQSSASANALKRKPKQVNKNTNASKNKHKQTKPRQSNGIALVSQVTARNKKEEMLRKKKQKARVRKTPQGQTFQEYVPGELAKA